MASLEGIMKGPRRTSSISSKDQSRGSSYEGRKHNFVAPEYATLGNNGADQFTQ
jgi:hypothetical protein